ncbi:MAG: ArsA-related P-loop ATPase, partial [Acidimicrobiales bacterium]
DHIGDPWFSQWKDSQRNHLAAIEEGFAPLPVLRAELADAEIVGVDRLSDFGASLYGDLDAASVLIDRDPLRIERCDDGFVLSLDLPFATKAELDVTRSPEELFIRVGPYRRAVLLPDSLRRREVAGASLGGGVLDVTFA